jgi:UDP-GlcNAc:undecaprenyl-phosphate GlcNAc-1-phosphate transferase
MDVAADFVLGVVLGVPLTWLAVRLGRRLQLLDVPVGIKVHRDPMPHTGGAAIIATMLIAELALGLPRPLLAGAFLMWAVGFVDDIRALGPRTKLLLEIVPLLVAAVPLGFEPPALLLTVAFGLFLVNAFNVIDGLDGLAGGVALISVLGLALTIRSSEVIATAAVLAGALTAFLLFNLHPARIFLGDQGSLLLGFFLWILPLQQYATHRHVWAVLLGALVFLSFPLVNAVFVITRRLAARSALLVGRRDHLYDVLNARWGLRSTLLICWSIAAIWMLAGSFAFGV